MGNENAKHGQGNLKAEVDTSKLDITIKQIYYTAQLSKDRRKGLVNNKVKELTALVSQDQHLRKKDDEYHRAASIVNDLKFIHALELIMRYCDLIKDNIGIIKTSKGDLNKISELIPCVESIIWGCQKCNVEGSQDLVQIIERSFGPEAHENISNLSHVTQELRDCFDLVLPSEKQVHDYFIEFCRVQNFDIKNLNEVGHNIVIPTQNNIVNTHIDVNRVDNKESIGHQSQETPSFPKGQFFPDGFSQGLPSGHPNQNQYQNQGGLFMSFGNQGNQPTQPNALRHDDIEERKIDFNGPISKEEGNNAGVSSKYPDFSAFSVVGKNNGNGDGLNELEDRLNAIKRNL